jgi:hypothetical protein
MSATRPFANTLLERAALLVVVAGDVAEEEPDDDGLGLEEEGEDELGREMPEVTLTEGNGIAILLPDTVEDVPEAVMLMLATDSDVLEEAAADEVDNGNTVMGPGPRLNRRVNNRIFIVNGPTGSDLRYPRLCQCQC